MPVTRSSLIPSLALLVSTAATAQQAPQDLAYCAALTDNAQRLACYDRFAAASGAALKQRDIAQEVQPLGQAASTETAPGPAQILARDPNGFSLAHHWDLDPSSERGTFTFRPHHGNYLIATRSHRPNDEPYLPFRPLAPTSGLSHAELVYQLGFKMKLVNDAFNRPLDLWFGYTQNSFWQAGNREASSPFRETNYSPELMAVTPLKLDKFGVKASFVGLGFVHQSNGQASTISRSWNRFYAQFGIQHGPLTINARLWKRVSEPLEEDNNPTILDYMGHGDLNMVYRDDGHEYSVLLRRNLSTDKGAVQLGWAFPLAGPLKGYLYGFSGYGQSLIDYNYFQRTIGLGVHVRY